MACAHGAMGGLQMRFGAMGGNEYQAGRGIVGADQNCQTASAVACNTLRQLCGREWSPQEVLLPCSRPRDAQPFRSFYRAALVRFDADHLSVVFARSWLSHRIRGANPALHRSLMQQAVTMERKINTALPASCVACCAA